MINLDTIKTDNVTPNLIFFKEKRSVSINGEFIGYTSQLLIDSVIDTFDKTNQLDKNLIKLIKNGIINPFMYFKKDNGFMVWKMLPLDQFTKAVWGWYTGSINNKIYLSINSMSYINGILEASKLRDLAVHELMHLGCFNFSDKFIDLFSNRLHSFYKSFINNYFKTESTNSQITSWLKLLMKNEIHDDASNYLEKYVKYLASISNLFHSNGYNKKKNNDLIDILSQPSSIYKRLKNNPNNEIQQSLKTAYKKVFKFEPPNFLYQELLYPSEVIAVYSQDNKQNGPEEFISFIAKNLRNNDDK